MKEINRQREPLKLAPIFLASTALGLLSIFTLGNSLERVHDLLRKIFANRKVDSHGFNVGADGTTIYATEGEKTFALSAKVISRSHVEKLAGHFQRTHTKHR